MSEYNEKPVGWFGRLFGAGQKKAEAQAKADPKRKTITFRGGDRVEGHVLEETAFTVVFQAKNGKIHRLAREGFSGGKTDEERKWEVVKVDEPRGFDAARSSQAGAPGDEGTMLFGKEGPREFGKGDIASIADRKEADRFQAQSAGDMSAMRARIFCCFLNPPPKSERDLIDRAHLLRDLTLGVLESEGVDVKTASKELIAIKRSEVRAEADAMKVLKLLAAVAPPDEHKIWNEAPDTYALTSDGAAQAMAVYEVATGART